MSAAEGPAIVKAERQWHETGYCETQAVTEVGNEEIKNVKIPDWSDHSTRRDSLMRQKSTLLTIRNPSAGSEIADAIST